LYYAGVNHEGQGTPVGPPWYVYAPGMTAQTVAEAFDALRRMPEREANLRAVEAEWQAQRFDGPIAATTLAADVGSAAYAANRVEAYALATGRDLFRDLLNGTNPEIALARHNGEWSRNQGLSYDPALVAIIDSLQAKFARK
jgi:hypothetical protein